MTPFLKQVADHYYSAGKLRTKCFVFPNRRSMVFFRKHLADAVASDPDAIPIVMPEMITVNDLFFLKRGGRVSGATAVVGTMLQIKPVLHVDDEGHLINVAKARGRKASIEALAKKVGETGLPGENDTVFISHGDCIEDVKTLEAILKEKYGIKNVFTYYVGAVIGSHSGPGTLALFFLGSKR